MEKKGKEVKRRKKMLKIFTVALFMERRCTCNLLRILETHFCTLVNGRGKCIKIGKIDLLGVPLLLCSSTGVNMFMSMGILLGLMVRSHIDRQSVVHPF